MEKIESLYRRNTQVVYSLLCLAGALFIVVQVVLPTISSVSGTREELKAETQKLESYNESLSILKKSDDAALSGQADIAVSAVPPSKDVQAIYLALTQSAQASQLSVRGFTVKIGDVFQKGPQEKVRTTGVPFVLASLQVSGATPASLFLFSQALYKQLPLSTIVSAKMNSGEADLDIAFYYKPFDLSVINRNTITPVTVQDQKILNSLTSSP